MSTDHLWRSLVEQCSWESTASRRRMVELSDTVEVKGHFHVKGIQYRVFPPFLNIEQTLQNKLPLGLFLDYLFFYV